MKHTARRTLLLLALVLVSALNCGAAFEKSATYTPGQFTDVPETAWYAEEVKNAYELSFMNGVGGGLFLPEGDVTVAEAVTMAARAAAAYRSETIDTASAGEWYAPYVSYAERYGILDGLTFDNYDRPAKRREVALLFAKALPEDSFAPVNTVDEIPDVPASCGYRDALLTLYRAGVVMGSDAYGNFFPENNITRAEAAAVINRAALPEARLTKTLDRYSSDDAYLLATVPSLNSAKEGINSGWQLDSRGALPRTSLFADYISVNDVSTRDGVAYIRPFNRTDTGRIVLKTVLSVGGYDGVYLEFTDQSGACVYRIETVEGAWSIRGTDGTYTGIYTPAQSERTFTFDIEVDLDNGRSRTVINGKLCGTSVLLTEEAGRNVSALRMGTTADSTAYLRTGTLHMYVNYALYEDFAYPVGNALPTGWTGENAAVSDGTLTLDENGKVQVSFLPVSGKAVAEFMVLLPQGESVSYALKSGVKSVAVFTSDKNTFSVNGETVYRTEYNNLWYRVRLEADTDNQTVSVKLNGRKIAEVPFAEAATSVDTVTLDNTSGTEVFFDGLKVFRVYDRADYVPEPVIPQGGEAYTVGINVCSLWQNGGHYGWSCISPYDDFQPVLGYYDEGNPETADWELKYMIEHGIDFQAFCVYFDKNSEKPQRLDAAHLFDGFMNAKYSDLSHFCVIWEAANAGSPASMEEWKTSYVPYFIENFFKDERYMTIDNRLVLCVFGAGSIASRLGGDAAAKQAFDYLEEEVKKLGFDGMLYLACGNSSDRLASIGYDGCYAYNWGNQGYRLDVNKSAILASASNKAVYTVPTVSVGFNSLPWNGKRYPMMSGEDYAAAHEWVKNDYLPAYASEDWQKNFVMLSTWNEYGEGTYIMPTADERGFMYLDVLREAYTGEKATDAVNTVPNAQQKTRINRLYPQHIRLLRKNGDYVESVDLDKVETALKIDYSQAQGIPVDTVTDPVQDARGISGISTKDSIIQVNRLEKAVNLDTAVGIRVTAKIPAGNVLEVFFTTSADGKWDGKKCRSLVSDTDELTEYVFNMTDLAGWTGELKALRIDPVAVADQPFTLQSAEILVLPERTPKRVTVNGRTYDTAFGTLTAENGDRLMAFDPGSSLDFLLDVYYEWDRAAGMLTLYFSEHTLVFTLGSDTYLSDGQTVPLGYSLTAIDGLPLIPIERVCRDVGYAFHVGEDGTVEIETDDKAYFDMLDARGKPSAWEFEYPGYNEGWTSSLMSLITADGYMRCESLRNFNDPTIWSETVELVASAYTTLEYRVRYRYEAEKPESLTMYYITDKDSNWNEQKTLKVKLKSTDSGGEWETYSVDLSAYELWQDTVVRLRFDPFNAVGCIDVDYIRFVRDPDWKEPDPADIPITLANPDAEGATAAFSEAAIVTDPDDPANHCYRVQSHENKGWQYTRQNVTFKPGQTYHVKCRLRLDTYGGKAITDDAFSASVLCNIRYWNEDKNGSDHLVKRMNLTYGNGWTTFEFEFTVSENSTDRSADQFTFYSDPVNDVGVGYLFDDVEITEVTEIA